MVIERRVTKNREAAKRKRMGGMEQGPRNAQSQRRSWKEVPGRTEAQTEKREVETEPGLSGPWRTPVSEQQ